jgi:hypothetical protein
MEVVTILSKKSTKLSKGIISEPGLTKKEKKILEDSMKRNKELLERLSRR